jgi:hypothetical protein
MTLMNFLIKRIPQAHDLPTSIVKTSMIALQSGPAEKLEVDPSVQDVFEVAQASRYPQQIRNLDLE